ncbi:MAG: MFS transporter [Solirubrobacteraceae bacterium]|nr:MFS transporter [Solirubrobacteraceae bacterium]
MSGTPRIPGARTAPSVTFAVLAVAAASLTLLQSLVNPVLPTIQHDLGTTQNTVTWVFTAWLLSAAIATPLLGKVGDMVGKKRTLVVALGAVALGSAIAASAPSIEWLLVGRVVQGLGGAIFPLSFGIIRDEFPAARVPSAVGVMSAVIAVGSGLGAVLAGPIVDAVGWRGLFWIPMAVVLATAVVAAFRIPESPARPGGRINWLAAGLLAGWLVALILPVSKGAIWGWGSAEVLGLFAVAVALVGVWLTVEMRSRESFIDLRMMRLPAVWTTNLVALLYGAAMFSAWAFLPQLVQVDPAAAGYGLGLDVTGSGLVLLPMLVTMAVAGGFSGPLGKRISAKRQLTLGSVFSALSMVGFAFAHGEIWQVALGSGVFGIGIGLAFASMATLIVQGVDASQTGVATGMNANIRTIGGAIGGALFSTIVTGHLQSSGLPAEAGYTDGFILLAILATVAVGVSLLIPTPRRAPRTQAEAVARDRADGKLPPVGDGLPQVGDADTRGGFVPVGHIGSRAVVPSVRSTEGATARRSGVVAAGRGTVAAVFADEEEILDTASEAANGWRRRETELV